MKEKEWEPRETALLHRTTYSSGKYTGSLEHQVPNYDSVASHMALCLLALAFGTLASSSIRRWR